MTKTVKGDFGRIFYQLPQKKDSSLYLELGIRWGKVLV